MASRWTTVRPGAPGGVGRAAPPRRAPVRVGALTFVRTGEQLQFVQELGPSAGKAVGDVGWDGGELVAVRLHIPSRVTYHNAPSRLVERGNILSWEQQLKARLAGEPLRVEARFGVQRILVLTVALFLAAMAAAAITVAGLIWWVVRKGHQRDAPPGLTHDFLDILTAIH